MEDSLIQSHTAEAANAAAIAQEAIEKSRNVQINSAVKDAIAEFFSRGVENKKFIDIGRIPFICDDIVKIHISQSSMENNIWWIMTIGGGIGGTILLGIGYLALKGIGA